MSTDHDLPEELATAREMIKKHAENFGLSFFEVI